MNTNILRELRKDAGKKKEEIAEVLGVTYQQYSLYENGERNLKIEQIIKLCKYYKVSANYILGLPSNLPYPKG